MTKIARIDRLEPDAWERVRAVRLRALTDAPDAFGSTISGERERPEHSWRGRLEYPSSIALVAAQDGEDVGLAFGAPYDGKPGFAGLFGMWVAPEARGSGVSRRLVRCVIDWAISQDYANLLLEVADDNKRAVAFYARMGFEPTGATGSLPAPREHIREHERVLSLTRSS